MKVAILAGGLGTRMTEETEIKPKPMVEIGGRPILWHILKHYARYGHKEFFIALGYKSEVVKNYFINYTAFSSSLTVDLSKGKIEIHNDNEAEDWVVHLIDTGRETSTGGRLKRLQKWLGKETFMATYGDGVSNVDLNFLAKFHKEQGLIGTLTAVRPPSRFGGILFDKNSVAQFTEKPQIGEGWINGGFFVFEPKIFDYLKDDQTVLEAHALEKLADAKQLAAYKHEAFWQCMDTLREKKILEDLWQSGKAPWLA
jgi:glucose-1-phosphate cytidylyltransferase